MLYTFNLSCSNYDPSAPYVTGWSYGNSAVTDPVGLVARTGPAPPYRPTLTLSNVVIGNTSIALRIGDVQSSRPAPNAYGNPIEQYELQLEDLDAPSGSPPISLTSTTFSPQGQGVSDSHQTSGLFFVGSSADAPSTAGFDVTAASATLLVPADDYRVRVRASNSQGWSSWSLWLQVHTMHRPSPPTNLTVVVTTGRTITIGWLPSTEAQLHCPVASCLLGYVVETSTGSPPTQTTAFVPTNAYQPSYTTNPALADFATTATFRVAARNTYGDGPFSDPITATSDPGPAVVGSISVGRAPAPATRLTYTWSVSGVDDNGSPIDKFEVLLCEGSAGFGYVQFAGSSCAILAASAIVSTGTTPAAWQADSTIFKPGRYYRLRVRANSTAFPSFASATFTNTGNTRNYMLPYAPNAAQRKSDNGGVNNITNLWLTWSSQSSYPEVTSYRLEYTVNGVTMPVVESSSDEWRIESLPASASVTVRIASKNAIGWSDWFAAPTPFATADPVAPAQPEAPTRGVLFETGGATNVSAIAVAWEAPQSLAIPILEYWLSVEGGVYTSPTRVPTAGARTFAQLAGLTNDTAYTFTVAARNAIGWGLASPPTTLRTWQSRLPQAPNAPSLRNGGLYASGYSTATSVYLDWWPPYDFEEAIISYQLTWSPPTASGRTSMWVSSRGPAGGSAVQLAVLPPSCEVSRENYDACLSPSTEYSVTVRARNAEGWGPASEALQFTTSAGTPPQRPAPPEQGELAMWENNITGAAIRWQAPSSLGPVQAYRIFQNGTEVDTVGRWTLSRTYTLQPDAVYAFQIMASSMYGDSPLSEPAYFRTQPPRPPKPPELAEVSKMKTGYYKQTALYITWTEPSNFHEIGSTVDEYDVRFCGPLPDGPCGNKTLAAPTKTFTATYLHTGLIPGSNYSYTVAARSSYEGVVIGWSPMSQPLVATTLPATLPTAPVGLAVQNRPWLSNATNIRLVWRAPRSYWKAIDHYWLCVPS